MKLVAACVLVLAVLCGCTGGRSTGEDPAVRTGGNAHTGRQVIAQAGCGSCHTIPGVRGANGLVGPPLTSFALRTFIAGHFPNTPEQLVSWVRDPQALLPGDAMPTLGLTEQQARDVAAYLYTLR